MKRLVICYLLLQFAFVAFAQSFNAPKAAERILSANQQNVKTILQNVGFTNVTVEKKAVEAAGGRVLTIYSAFHKGISPKCDVYFSAEKKTAVMASIKYMEYENEDILFDCYKKAGYTLVSKQVKPAYMNQEQRDRYILRWEKKTNTGTLICISEIADVVHDNSVSLIDLEASFFMK